MDMTEALRRLILLVLSSALFQDVFKAIGQIAGLGSLASGH